MNIDIKCKDDYFNAHYIIKQLPGLEIDIDSFEDDELKDEWLHQDLFLDFMLTINPDFSFKPLHIHERTHIVTSPLKPIDLVETEDYIYNITCMLDKNNYSEALKKRIRDLKKKRRKELLEQNVWDI